jgi:hypothetical protein
MGFRPIDDTRGEFVTPHKVRPIGMIVVSTSDLRPSVYTMRPKHPKRDEAGRVVDLFPDPIEPTHPDTWEDQSEAAIFVPDHWLAGRIHQVPTVLHGIPVASWTAPQTRKEWRNVPGQNLQADASRPLELKSDRDVFIGVVIREGHRVWMVEPTHHFLMVTFPQGRVQKGFSPQQTAIRQAYRETGLQVRIVGLLGDLTDQGATIRYYVAERVGGSPQDMGWQTPVGTPAAATPAPGGKMGRHFCT